MVRCWAPAAGCDPHPTRTSGAAGCWASSCSSASLRSSPDANVGCSRSTLQVRRRGSRTLRSSPDANVGCSPSPTCKSGASCELRSSPDANVGCSRPPHRRTLAAVVAILTRRERRVQPQSPVGALGCRSRLRSSPDANVGCSVAPVTADRRPVGCDPHPTRTSGAARRSRSGRQRAGVAILTRRERRVQPQSPVAGRHRPVSVAILTRRERRVQPGLAHRSPIAVRCCDPHPTRTSGAARCRVTAARCAPELRSSPDANVGCSRAAPRRSTGGEAEVAILTRRERRVQLWHVPSAQGTYAWLRSSPDANVGCSSSRAGRIAAHRHS